MSEKLHLDSFDIKLLAQIQEDAGQTNQEIGEKIHLSPSQISRRRQRLEQSGVIKRYRADLSPSKLGLSVTAFVGISLSNHSKENSKRFFELVQNMTCVQEAYTMTGDIDYMLKVCVPDLKTLSKVISDDFLSNEAVQNVRSSIAMETLKSSNHLPLEYVS
ncbi:Lrp/AsnC family transcriptional regulator [Rhodobacteraceae bacterium RKSG542]|uniref:Lrp/AsnC family transcriptional regulator n=1 Tax=Pseudovibrio flavus TaxID=2529854 RepID=UPI0012BBAE4A|nr:Lrp/AsnC family transcriptional regulator [Pseudovibrio flavus]MTI16786.1 Lrp/AsnC family transcriptional regulator [Pseudovibrio flavus]